MKRSLHVLLILGITCMALIARGQDTVLNMHPHGILDSLHSPILNQERMIQVFLPSDYKPGSAISMMCSMCLMVETGTPAWFGKCRTLLKGRALRLK